MGVITMKVKHCSACGEDHAQVEKVYKTDDTGYFVCPTTDRSVHWETVVS